MHDLTVINQQDLPSAEKLSTLSIPNQYKTVYIVSDTYKINSIKSGEPILCGDGKVYILYENKVLLLNLINAESNGNNVMVRSPSGDVDILVLFILHQFGGKTVFIDNGVGKNLKIIDMSTTVLSSRQRHAFAGVHAFSGNVYISSFFQRGKKKMWNLVLKNERFLKVFLELGLFNNTTDDAIAKLEELVCYLYRDLKIKKVGKLRVKLFQTSFNGDRKNIDLISLPRYSNLHFQIDRACYVANMFCKSRCLMLLDDPVEHG